MRERTCLTLDNKGGKETDVDTFQTLRIELTVQ